MMRDAISFDLGQAILSTYVDGFLGIGVDVPGYETAGTSTFDARFPYGTFGRPRDPDVSADQTSRLGAIVQFGFAGRDRHAWVLDDPRVTPKLPEAPKGTWGAFADTGREELPVLVLDGTTGSFALHVPHSTGGGVASRVLVDVETPGAEEIVLAHGGGCEVRVRATETIVGDPLTAQNIALAPDLIEFVSTASTVLLKLTAAVNVLAPGTITPPEITDLTAAALKYAGTAPSVQSAKLQAEPIGPALP
jgi:hypothetical protein